MLTEQATATAERPEQATAATERPEQATATAERPEQATATAERPERRAAPAGPRPASPDRGVTGWPPRRREEEPAPGERAMLSIGTVEITVLPPREHKSPAPPGPRRAGPAAPPERLSRGLGPWFGRDQA